MRRAPFNVALLLASLLPLPALAADETMIRDVPLQPFFHTRQPWRLEIYQPSGQDASFGNTAAKVCFVNPQDHSPQGKICQSLILGVGEVGSIAYPLQTIDSVQLSNLSSGNPAHSQPAIVVRATYSGGGAGAIRAVLVWTASRWDKDRDSFMLTFQSQTGEAGMQAFVSQGPLAGDFVRVDQIYSGDEPNMESPVRYVMDVYRPVTAGWQKVLSVISQKRWPSNHTGDGLSDAIQTLTPEITRALHAAYPDGLPALDDIPAQH